MDRHHPTDLKNNKLNSDTRKALQNLMKDKIDGFLVSVENQNEKEHDLKAKTIQSYCKLKKEEKTILHLEKKVKMLEENLSVVESDGSLLKTKMADFETHLQEENDFLSIHGVSLKKHENEYWEKIKQLDEVLQESKKIESRINGVSEKMLKESMLLKENEEQQCIEEERVFHLDAEMNEIDSLLLTSEIRNERLIMHLEALDQKIDSVTQRCNESENTADEYEEKTKQMEAQIEKLNQDLYTIKTQYERKQEEIVEANRRADLADTKLKTVSMVVRLCHKAQNIVKKRK